MRNNSVDVKDDVVKEALASGLDLRDYSKQIENELETVEAASIRDYIEESGNIASLHNQIATCDNILGRMENLLLSFQVHTNLKMKKSPN